MKSKGTKNSRFQMGFCISRGRVLHETPVYTVYMEEEMHLNFVKDMGKKKTLLDQLNVLI